jgi:hypothetical protein
LVRSWRRRDSALDNRPARPDPKHSVYDLPSSALRASEGILLRVRQTQPCVARSAKQGGGDGRINTPRQYSFSRQFVSYPPFIPRRQGCGLQAFALSPEIYQAGPAVQCT